MAALGRQFLGGKMTYQTAGALEELGIMPAGGHERAGGGIKMNPGAERRALRKSWTPTKATGLG
jgi:hypothetical protein